MTDISKAALIKVGVRIAGWVAIGGLAALGFSETEIQAFAGTLNIDATEAVISAVVLLVANSGFYFKDKLSKGET